MISKIEQLNAKKAVSLSGS